MSKRIEDLSDDEIAAMTPEQFAALSVDEPQDPPSEDEPAEVPAEPAEPAPVEEEEVPADEPEDAEPAPAPEDAPVEEPAEPEDAPKAKAKAPKAAEPKEEPKEADTLTADQQIAALYAPFKANGRDMQVTSVDEARQLMAMGANYSKKMSAMKPHLATLRMLENAKIGEAELNFLIDLHRKDPAAINKLVTDSGVDPMDLTADKAAGYTPGNHKPSEVEVELDATLQELQDTPSFARTIDIVTTKLDQASKKIIADNPQVLRWFNSTIEGGYYDQIQGEVERRRVFGQLAGLSDLAAYRQVGDEMNAQGKLAPARTGQSNGGQQAAPVANVPASNPKKAEDESKRNAARRAVAPVKSAAAPTKKDDFNPLALSDEEFMKKFK